MSARTRYIWVIISLFIGFTMGRSLAQGAQSMVTEPWLINEHSDVFEHKVLESIENLKRAEAAIDDSLTVAWLDSIGYLAIVQSNFTGSAKDENQRSGWWLLSYPVATKYGLTVNSVIDERMNLEKSTRVAYQYRTDLIKRYGDMADLVFTESPLAVSKFLSDSINYPLQFGRVDSISSRIKEVRKLYGLHKENHPVGPMRSVVKVTATQPISFESLHHFLQLPTTELQQLNPQWISGVFDPAFGKLILPQSLSEIFEGKKKEMEQKTRDDQITLAAINEKRIKQLKGNIPDLTTHKPISYKVKMGDNLGRIAQRYHVYISDLRTWNGLRNDRIYAGQRMTIYVRKNQKIAPTLQKEEKPQTKPLTPGEYENYTVQQGDTLWAISKKFKNVTIENIMVDNGIDENISPGQVLKIRKQ